MSAASMQPWKQSQAKGARLLLYRGVYTHDQLSRAGLTSSSRDMHQHVRPLAHRKSHYCTNQSSRRGNINASHPPSHQSTPCKQPQALVTAADAGPRHTPAAQQQQLRCTTQHTCISSDGTCIVSYFRCCCGRHHASRRHAAQGQLPAGRGAEHPATLLQNAKRQPDLLLPPELCVLLSWGKSS
jgi:hypothetical protein